MKTKLAQVFAQLPKPVRFIAKLAGKFFAAITAPVWFPALLVLWLITATATGLISMYEKA